MELLFRIAAAAVCTLMIGLILRRTNPELSALLSLAAIVMIVLSSLRVGSGLRELTELLHKSFGLTETYILPVLKCVAAAIVTRLTADLCRDASHTATASAVELAGTFCALGVIMPLLISMLKMIGGFL